MPLGFRSLDGSLYFVTRDCKITVDPAKAQLNDVSRTDLAKAFNPYLEYELWDTMPYADGTYTLVYAGPLHNPYARFMPIDGAIGIQGWFVDESNPLVLRRR